MVKLKTGLIRIGSICLINFMLNYLLLFPLDLFKFLTTPNLKMFGLVGIVVSGIPALTTILFYKLVDRKKIRTLGFQFNRRDILFSLSSLSVTVLLVMVVVLIGSKLGIITAEWNTEAFSEVSFYLTFIFIFITWFIAALYEEILFRGYLVSNLSFLSPKKLYFVSSLIFMIFHIFKGLDPISIVILMVISCVLLHVYLKSGSLLPCTFAHLIFNFSNTHLIGNSEIALLKFSGNLGFYNLMIIVLYVLVTIILTNMLYSKNVQSNFIKN